MLYGRLPPIAGELRGTRQKAQTVSLASYNTTFREQTYIRWCCIDLLRPLGLPDICRFSTPDVRLAR